MPNGMLNDLEFENQLNTFGDNQLELIKFVARQQFASSKLLTAHDTKITILESGDRKVSSVVGGISGTITAIVISIISHFTNRS